MRNLLVLTTRGRELVPNPFIMAQGLEVWTWDYTGATEHRSQHISHESPGGGTTLGWIFEWALTLPGWDYIGCVAHDIHGLTPGACHMMLDTARALDLAMFAPAQEHTQPGLPHMRSVPGSYLREVEWAESRSAWYHRDILPAVIPLTAFSQSGHGIDCYACSYAARATRPEGKRRIAVFDTVVTYHCDEPGRSMGRLYRGLSVDEEKLLEKAEIARLEARGG